MLSEDILSSRNLHQIILIIEAIDVLSKSELPTGNAEELIAFRKEEKLDHPDLLTKTQGNS